MSANFQRLKAHVISLSEANDFEAAKREWSLAGVELSEEWDNCPCGQDIKEHCFIRNTLNGNETYVGNICINQFIGIDTGNLFDGLKRIAKNRGANVNEDLIIHAHQLGYIYPDEYRFLMDTRRKRRLSEKQLSWKRKINHRILNKTVVQRRTDR